MPDCLKIFVILGRFGDVVSVLPMILHQHQIGNRPVVCVSKDFASILDAVGYCDRIISPHPYNDPPATLRWLKQHHPNDEITICQAYRNPVDQDKKTGSWQTENWRVARALDQFGKHPTVFDKRDHQQEGDMFRRLELSDYPIIAVVSNSISSPFKQSERLLEEIRIEFGRTHSVVDLARVRFTRPHELLCILDRATCLVTTDTFPLHLARASKCPVVAILNDGFFGSIPPPATVRSVRYADCAESLQPVLEGVAEVVLSERPHRFVIFTVDVHGQTERHLRARQTWPDAMGDEDVIELWGSGGPKPKLKPLLARALKTATCDRDVIVWTNDDVAMLPGSFTAIKHHAGLWGACSMRRAEPGSNKVHIGRELFAFRAEWLADHIDDIPDFFLAAPAFDIVLAAMIRRERGVVSTLENMALDFFPCEMAPGLAIHEAHRSSWAGDHEHTRPENLHNLALARAWCRDHAPDLKL